MPLINIQTFTFDINSPLKAFIKSVIWLFFVVLCGSLPVLLISLLHYLDIGEADKKLESFNHELFWPFLCCAIIGEISFEAFLCKIKFSKYSYLFFGLSAGVVVIIVCLFYLIFFFKKPEEIAKLPATWIFQVIIVTYTSLYSLGVKTFMFFDEDKKA
jgi:hypothetical protein